MIIFNIKILKIDNMNLINIIKAKNIRYYNANSIKT